MIEVILAVVLSGLPTPHFGPLPAKLPTPKFGPLPAKLPTPKFGPLPVKTVDPFAEPEKPVDPTTRRDARGRLIRLPGPVNWYRCPQCGSSTDLMYLGQHLRGAHKISNAKLDEVGWQNLAVYHDNLHNLTWTPRSGVTAVPTCTTCESGSCQVGPFRRLLRGW